MFRLLQRHPGAAIGALIIFLAIAGKVWLFPAKAPQPVTAAARLADLERSVLATGTLEPKQLVSVGAQVSGQLKSLKVALGDSVRAGQLIAEIDSAQQENTVRSNAAALDNVRAQRRAKQAALKQAELNFARQARMLAGQASSREDYDSAEATLESTRADIAALDAQIVQAQTTLDTARVNLGYTRITAPIDGTVVAIVTKQGQTVNSNQTAPTIVKLAKLDVMTVKAEISEADVVKVRPGQTVYFTILGDPDRRRYATLREIEPAPDSISTDSSSSSSGSSSSSSSSTSTSSSAIYYNGRLDVENPDGVLRTYMTAQVTILLEEAKGALAIPSTALGPKGPDGRSLVRKLEADGTIRPLPVRIGLDNNVDAQVLEGLAAGDRVVVGEASAEDAARTTQAAMPFGPPPGGMGGPPPGMGGPPPGGHR